MGCALVRNASRKVGKTTNHDKPIASIDEANAHIEAFAASEIQYVTKLNVVHVRICGGTGSMSLLLQALLGANVEGSGSSFHADS